MKFKSEVQLEALNNATVDTDKFLVSDSSTVKYRTGAQVLSDIGGQSALTNPVTGTGTLNYVSKFTGTSTLGNSLIFDNGTNVGIGTSSPATKLEVSGIASFTGSGGRSVVIEGQSAGRIDINGNNGGGYAVGIRFNSSLGGTALSGIWNFGSGTSQQWLALGGTAYNNSAMYILPSGNVGIGATNPLAKLEVNAGAGTPAFYNGIAINTGNGTYTDGHGGILQFQNEDVITAAIRGVRESGWGSGMAIYTHNTSSGNTFGTTVVERMRITSAGDVGIGTTSPSAKLDVNGDALINGLTIGRGGGNDESNTAIGAGALESNVNGTYNIALGAYANSDEDISGLTAIGVGLNFNTNLQALGDNCLAISQFNNNAVSQQVPHIYAPGPISIDSEADTDIITFDVDHYAGAIVEYMIRLDDGGDYAVGTVYMGWKSGGSGTLRDVRQTEWSDMSGFEFRQLGNSTLSIRNITTNTAWIRITVRGMMTN
jgi:hypothetical protein